MVGRGKVVMCIDDSEVILSVVEGALTAEGYQVLCAQSGPAGLCLLGQMTIDAIVVDLQMPGMNGIVVAQCAKKQLPKLPVIMFSGDSDHIEEYLPSEIDCFVHKPNLGELISAVRRYTWEPR